MHYDSSYIYSFIDSFDKKRINNLSKNYGIIYRNYQKKINLKLLLEIKKFCRQNNKKLIIANDIRLAIRANIDGVYIPSFNKKHYSHILKNKKKNFLVMGSAHNVPEIKTKEEQGVDLIFLSPMFLTKNYKKELGVIKFNLLSKNTKKKIIALGGIKNKNLKKLKMTKSVGFAGISYFN
ncbi:thiamine phosphate synthase [Candidatus Pelagibacter communis]|uniref:thiamine phosphate synthase n=1 Tax=Pelagibacter ubique TaxID=198252 RepID=UPI00094DA6BD|nr:thiamine phosphate synthase [Candidatus Pelagibacter ubique]|tara:strand:+ start:2466 stop:3002 length:537 start_codon:yes stop_codon:yes gene_type:complete